MPKTDYYTVLGVEKTASDDQIKDAYKKLAKQWHPDRNKNNVEEANKKFNEVSEAYNVLKDPAKRKTYDNFWFAGIDENENGGHSGSPFGHGFDPFSMFKDFFQKESDIPEVQVPVKVILEDLYSGITKQVKYDRYSLCKPCKAKGCIGDNVECTTCKGKGATIARTPLGIMQSQCRMCGGKGVDPKAPKCKDCNGVGCFKESHSITVNIPKGSSEKHPIIVENEGNEIPEDERNDNNNRTRVVIIINEASHKKFSRGTVIKEVGKINENNLVIEIKLTLEESLCGFKKTFTHLDGKHFNFNMSTMVKHGEIFVMKGQGMPYFNDDKRMGDLIIKISVENKEIPQDKKEKIWKLLSTEPYTEVKKSSPNIINYNDYKEEVVQENKKESMKNKYRRRQVNDSDDDDGDENFNMRGGPPQCAQQ